MRGILWHVTRKLEGIFDGILMEFHMRISEDKNQIPKSMYIPRYLSSCLYGIINILVILIGPNHLGHDIGCDNVWA